MLRVVEPAGIIRRMSDIILLRHLVSAKRNVVRTNTAGVTHEQSLIAPKPAGNNMNWVVGHIQLEGAIK